VTERRLYLDEGVGEIRGVVTLDGRPERLLIARDGDLAIQAAGARAVARVRRIERAQNLAFLDLGDGPDAVLNLKPEFGRIHEGQALEVEIRSEARRGKGGATHFLGPAEGPPRLLAAAPTLEQQLRGYARNIEPVTGPPARQAADAAVEEALQSIFPLPGGGSVAVEPTRALTAVDVDLGTRAAAEAKRAARQANLAALATAARVLRLKGQGGLVVIDLAGRGHDGPALIAAARAAFSADNPGVAFGPISRFGTLELTIPRRSRPVLEMLTDETGEVSALTTALALIRTLERDAAGDGGGRFVALCAPDVAEAAGPYLKVLHERCGQRLAIQPASGRGRSDFEVKPQ
jgi:Ribonuclease G/E